jgi:uncharacterized protein (DUF427 family)
VALPLALVTITPSSRATQAAFVGQVIASSEPA